MMKQFADKTISIVIPMYNEVDNVEPLLNEIQDVFSDHSNYEIIVVDDGSNDGTGQKLNLLKYKMPQLRPRRHQGNFGQSASIMTGVRSAENDWIVTLDGDGQNDPNDIPNLFSALEEYQGNKDLLLIGGNRKKREDNYLRKLSSRIANGLRKSLLDDDCPDTGCGLKLFPREMFIRLPHFNHLHRFIPALVKRAGGQVINIPVNHRPRLRGTSKYGVMNRLFVGIMDLFGVAWLMRRPCNPIVE